MDGVNVSTLVSEILAGSSRAVIAMLILIITGLLNEIRLSRKENRDILDKLESQRESFLTIINEMQTRFSEKSEDMLEKYHQAIRGQNESNSKVREILSNVANLQIEQKNKHKGDD